MMEDEKLSYSLDIIDERLIDLSHTEILVELLLVHQSLCSRQNYIMFG